MIEMDKKYRTRDGRAVEILRTNVKNKDFPVVGIITQRDGSEIQDRWTANGWYYQPLGAAIDASDLVPVPTKHEAWAVVIDDHVFPGPCMVFNTKEGAEDHAKVCAGNLAYVAHVTWED
jgi:hypothetical protein